MLESEIIAAAKKNRSEEIRCLIASGANVDARDEDDNTPLMLVVALAASVSLSDEEDNKPLMLASYLETTKILLAGGADPLLVNRFGWSALDTAIISDTELERILTVASAKRRGFIEVKENDTTEIIVYKLITTLLYESSRHDWENDPCLTLRHYIRSLNPLYRDYVKAQFIDLIQKAETRHHTFFGSYLSDNSDSEDERMYRTKTSAEKREFENLANMLRERAQVKELCYQRKSGPHARGDLKLHHIDPSNLFDLPQRIQIKRNQLDVNPLLKQQVESDLAKHNEAFKRYSSISAAFIEATAGLQTQFVVAQYRGITYLTTKHNKPGRKAHRDLNEVGKAVYSQSVINKMGVQSFSQLLQKIATTENFDELAEAIAKQVKEILVSLRNDRGVSYKGYAFNCLADLLQHAYSTDYHRFHQLIQNDQYLRDLLLNYFNPFVSTGDIPYHAAKYALGMKPYKGYEWQRIRPRWQLDGTVERPYSGKLYVSLHPLTDYIQAGPNHLISLVWQGRVQLDNLIVAERESSFLGYIPEERVVAQYKAKYISFKGPYKKIYLHKYGIDENLYLNFKAALQAHPPHSPEHKVFKKLLGEWLCSYNEVRMINRANSIAQERGQVLVYRDENGLFSLTPPIDTPTRNGVPEEQKTPVKQQRNRRKEISSPNKGIIDEVNVPYSLNPEAYDAIDPDYLPGETQDKPDLITAVLLNAVNNRLTGALKHFLSNPHLARYANYVYDSCSHEGMTLLHAAAGLNSPELIELLSLHVDLNRIMDEDSRENTSRGDYFYLENLTPLLYAVVCNAKESVNALLKNVNVNKNAMANGVRNKDRLQGDLFIVYDSNRNDWDEEVIADFDGGSIVRIYDLSALYLAVKFASPAVLKLLIDAGIKDTKQEAYDLALRLKKTEHAELLRPKPIETVLPEMEKLNLDKSASNKQKAPSNIAPHAATFKAVLLPAAVQTPKGEAAVEKVMAAPQKLVEKVTLAVMDPHP